MSKSTVLIVDDEPAGRETLEALLLKEDYHLGFARNGMEALTQAADLTPDVILLDVMMPAMDGFEVCRRLRSDPNLSEVPVIMVTALDDQDSRMQGIEAGADDFISKPFNRTELRARIRTITRLNRYRRLLSERARFEWVVEQTEDGFLIMNEWGTILYANPQARRYLGLPYATPEDSHTAITDTFLTLAQKHYDCQPPEAWQNWAQTLAGKNEQSAPVLYLVRPETPTSLALWLEVDSINLPAGELDGLLIRLRDVTDKMSQQRQMWTFHGLISHKLSTPLTGLINSLYLLANDSTTLTAEEVKEFSDIALQSAQRLNTQLRDIRNYLRTPDIASPGEGCNISCVEHILAQINEELELDNVSLTMQGAIAESRFILSSQAIELILRQLLENARKFHPSHAPTVTLELVSPRPDRVTIRLSDDGINLSPDQLSEVWIPYYQAERGFSGEISGMGLGLAMVAALLWSVGGTYHMTNREGGPGIVVELTIPLA